FARLVVHVPVKRFGERQALRRLQPKRMHVVDEQQKRGKLLAARDNAELGGLLDGVGGVAAGVGEPNDLGFRRLRLQQERRKIRGVARMPDPAEALAATSSNDSRGSAP